MPRVEAARELPLSRGEVWELLDEPQNLVRWWPDIVELHAGSRGLVPGARWALRGDDRLRFRRRPQMSGALVVLRVRPPELLAFHLTGDRIEVELRLEPAGERTQATLTVDGPWLIGLSRAFPTQALNRLRALCQTPREL